MRKFSFEISDLSKNLMKNFQPTINVISDKGDDEFEVDDLSEQTT